MALNRITALAYIYDVCHMKIYSDSQTDLLIKAEHHPPTTVSDTERYEVHNISYIYTSHLEAFLL